MDLSDRDPVVRDVVLPMIESGFLFIRANE